MPLFSLFNNYIITGSTFNFHTPTSEGFNILHGNIAPGAFHDLGERFGAPKCRPNTRRAVIEKIMRWIRDMEPEDDILWLYGSAGAGKSAFAETIAELCAKLELLVTSFFFAGTNPSRNNEKHLISSIAYRLALSIPATRTYIESVVQNDPEIINKSLETQIEIRKTVIYY
ncbi:hypothetical protein BYT27DRAFT_7248494 [Phlegmacium glaucopus]|nr:hypothetical protein BYT27DRAFT_7248494 [Phlegmacium glaucopus]